MSFPRWIGICALFVAGCARIATADDSPGKQIYERKCIDCHGAEGAGTDDYPRLLVGDRSPQGLARFIEKNMPKGSPGDCVGDDAQQVAAYIHDAFYSKAAQARLKPPRIELSRLTVRQYRSALADLVGSFRSGGRWSEQRGLRGEYFKSGRFRDRDRVLERVDPQVRFDFQEASPDPAKLDAPEFSIRWNGSVLAPETGEYEFIVRTEHAARLWFNDLNQPLIDAWVKSGNDTEYRGAIFLLGGRAYPLRLEFSKAKQGVDDSKDKDKPRPAVKASIALLWKLPQRPAEAIPERNLSPTAVSEVFVASIPFPPDDRSIGYERGNSISKAWDQATTDAAIETANYVVAHLKELAGAGDNLAESEPRLRDFVHRFAETAFHRPLTSEQQEILIERRFKGAPDMAVAVKQAILLILKSPAFLYREAGTGDVDGYDVATRLSFGLWDSLPDKPLIEAAAAGQLVTREQVAQQAQRMLSDLRTQSKLRQFLMQWLKVEQPPDLSKDAARFPGFDAALASDLRTSLDLFLGGVIASDAADFRQLLLADYVYLNGPLAKFYGASLPEDAPFQKVVLDSGQRAGVLSHPYLMADFAYAAASSPIHRGVFVVRNVLGRTLRPPPEAVVALAPDLHPDLTTRQRVELQTSGQTCQACHGLINPLGFTLEHFDAVGRFRADEQGKQIDAKGSYETRAGEQLEFSGIRDLAKFLADSEETHAVFVEHLFHHLVKQSIYAYGPQTAADLRRSFVENSFNIRRLMVEMMASSALKSRDAKP